jgi:ribosomal protein S18 acetylase RimI-like enzyme
MTDHPDQLYAVDFTESDQARLIGFSCGDDVWSRHVAQWIQGSDVLDSMQRGSRVWLFENQNSDVIGFASLGTSRWRWPPPGGSPTTIALIPMLGIDVRFHGLPADPHWKYSRQIMSHLVAEAQQLSRGSPENTSLMPEWLVLMVHRDNARAIHYYENCGFEQIVGVVRRNDHLVM